MTRKNLLSKSGSGNARNRKNSKTQKSHFSIAVLASLIIFISAGLFFAQGNSQQSGDKADQKLKSTARINPITHAMEFSLPLGNYPGRAGNALPVAISYSSKLWAMEMSNYHHDSYTVPSNPQYVTHEVLEATDVTARFSEKAIAGWTSSLRSPEIGDGQVYNAAGGLYHSSFAPPSNVIIDGWDCEWTQPQLRADVSCPSGWALVRFYRCRLIDLPMDPIDLGEDVLGCETFFPPPGGWPTPSPTPTPVEPQLPTPAPEVPHTVNQLTVIMADGASHEFRADDQVCNHHTGIGCGDADRSYLSVDGTGMRFEPSETLPDDSERPVLHLQDGGQYIFPETMNGIVYGSAEKFVDRNGNVSTYNKTTRTWTDTVGRQIADPLPKPGPFPDLAVGPQTYNIKGINNANVPYELNWQRLEDVLESGDSRNLKPLGRDRCSSVSPTLVDGEVLFESQDLPNGGVEILGSTRYKRQIRTCTSGWGVIPLGLFDPIVLEEVKLPNGSKYEFRYNEYGEITKIVYPTGGYERFEYDFIQPMGMGGLEVYTQANRGVHKRYVSFDGISETQEWIYSDISDANGYALRTTAPDGSKTERVLYSSSSYGFGFEDPRAGMVREERVKDTNGVLRSRTINDWIVLGPQGTGANTNAMRDPRLRRSVTFLFDPGSPSALATLSETDFDDTGSNDPTYFSHLNVKRNKAYHYAVVNKTEVDTEQLEWATITDWFSNKLASISETDYSYSSSYRERGIIGLPVETRILNPANPDPQNPLAKSQVLYDQGGSYALIDEGGTTGWEGPNSALRANATTSRTWNKDTNTWLETHAQFDNFGNLRKAWDASGDGNKFVETEFSPDYYYAYPTKVIAPAPDPSGTHGTSTTSSAETTYDPTTGLVLSVKDDFGQITRTEYNDPLLRPTRVFGDNFNAPIAETIYDDTNRTVRVRKQLDESNWDEATTFMDGFGRVIKTVAKDSEGDVTVETHYDLMGRVDRVTNPYRAGDTIYWNKTRYDELGRAVETYAPAALADLANAQSLGITSFGISTVTNYVGTVVTTTDASGRRGRSITNALGQLLRVDEPTAVGGSNDVGDVGSPNQPTYYKYDPYGNMVQVTQGVQNRYFKYDSLGRLIRVNQPEQEYHSGLDLPDMYNTSGHWTAAFTYDDLGNLVTAIDAKGVTTVNTYDRAGRVTTRAYYGEPAAGPTTPPVYFFYDGKGLGGEQAPNYAKGKLTKVSSSISETRYKLFDNFGRLKEMEQRTPAGTEAPWEATPRVSKYTYNLSSALVEEEYPSGRVVKNNFGTDGGLNAVSSRVFNGDYRTYASGFSYTASGAIGKLMLGNGRWETAQFNARQQVTQLGLGTSTTNASLWKADYEYGELLANGTVDPAKNTGNIARQILTIPATSFIQSYKYDPLYRLTEAREYTGTNTANPNWTQTFGYDVYGNRTSFAQTIGGIQTNGTPLVNPNTNRFTSSNFTYDKNGNVTQDIDPVTNQTRQTTFNGDNKQTEVKDANGTLVGKYYYDGEGKRIKKVTATETTVFVYSGGKLVAEYSTQISQNPTIAYTTTDHLGSPRVITDKTGNVKSRRDFMPFGEDIFAGVGGRTGDTGQRYSSSADDIRQKFTGYQKDSETNLDFAEARMYENRYGRFTAVDPLLASGKSANPQSFNRYIYVGNNPLNITDPSGEIWAQKQNGKFWDYYWYNTQEDYDAAYAKDNSLQLTTNFLFQNAGSGVGWISLDRFSRNAEHLSDAQVVSGLTSPGCSTCLRMNGYTAYSGIYSMGADAFLSLESDVYRAIGNTLGSQAVQSFLNDPSTQAILFSSGVLATESAIMKGFRTSSAAAVADDTLAFNTAKNIGASERLVQQYSLRARNNGYYPVMERGFKDPVGEVFLKEGDVWKFGQTINPKTRYTIKFLRETNLEYQTEAIGSRAEMFRLEKIELVNFRRIYGFLPPGNKILR